jgi:hypothetical protein
MVMYLSRGEHEDMPISASEKKIILTILPIMYP